MEARRSSVMLAVALGAGVAALAVVLLLRQQGGLTRAGPIIALLAVAAVIVAVLVAAIASTVRRRRQTEAAGADIALQLGLDYQRKTESDFHRQFGKLPGIPAGRGGKTEHLLTGRLAGRPLTAFQHLYITMAGQTPVPVYHTVYVIPTPPWPPVTIKRRGALGRLLYRFGARHGLQLEDEAFNRGMRVTTNDPDFALLLLGPDMQSFLLENPNVTWHINHGRVAVIYNRRLRFDRVADSLRRLERFFSLVPEELNVW